MFLRPRLLSASQNGAGLLLAAVAFALGLGLGATVGPVTATHRDAAIPASATSTAAKRPDAGSGLPRLAHPAEVLRVLDGDTFEARVHLWPGLEVTRACGCAASTRPN